MKAINTKVADNEFIRYVPDGTCVTMLVNDYSINTPIRYIHVLYSYGPWGTAKNLDIFQYFTKVDLNALKFKKIYLLFDITTEGFSPIYQCPLFKILYNNCEKYDIDPRQIIYASSNLLDEKNMEFYAKKKNKIPFNVLSFPAFQHIFLKSNKSIEKVLDYSKKLTHKYFSDKYFSSLSRNLRGHRALAHFILFNNPIFQKALTSHDRVTEIFPAIYEDLKNLGSDKQIKRWTKSLPMTIDQTNFEKNWALDTPYEKLYHQTLFHIVNETEINDFNKTTMFYSEKTFRAYRCFLPFVIYGQPGTNRYMEKLGFKLYYDWFDYSFDDIEDPIERYKKLLEMITKICNELDKMSREEKINWKFQNQEILLHNYNNMFENEFTKNQFSQFIRKI